MPETDEIAIIPPAVWFGFLGNAPAAAASTEFGTEVHMDVNEISMPDIDPGKAISLGTLLVFCVVAISRTVNKSARLHVGQHSHLKAFW